MAVVVEAEENFARRRGSHFIARRNRAASLLVDNESRVRMPRADEFRGAVIAAIRDDEQFIRLRRERGDLREGALELRTAIVRGDADGNAETHAGGRGTLSEACGTLRAAISP
jgi:hypothetical protein